MDKGYIKSLHTCPICGIVIGCIDEDTETFCDSERFRDHITECRKSVAGKIGRVRYEDEDK